MPDSAAIASVRADMQQAMLSEYLAEIARIRGTGSGAGEISYHEPPSRAMNAVSRALNAVGATLKPRVFCVPNLRNRGAGFPDMGLFAGLNADPTEAWPDGQPPDRGVVEADDIPTPIAVKAKSAEICRLSAFSA